MTTIAKVIRITAADTKGVEDIHHLLQGALDTIKPEDLKKLLSTLKKNPRIVKTALKFI